MSSLDEKSESSFSASFGGVEVDTTSSLILGATGDVWYFPKITPSGYNSYRAQLFELSMATAQLNLDFPCCWESNLRCGGSSPSRGCYVHYLCVKISSEVPAAAWLPVRLGGRDGSLEAHCCRFLRQMRDTWRTFVLHRSILLFEIATKT